MNNNRPISYRRINVMLFILACLGMVYALYLQYVQMLDPCPLCIFQRVGLIGFGLFALIAAVINPKKPALKRLLLIPQLLSILWATAVAARHVWLQSLPPGQAPSCGSGLEYLLDTFELTTVITTVLQGSGECALVDMQVLGLSIPQTSLIFFGLLTLVTLWLLIRRERTYLF